MDIDIETPAEFRIRLGHIVDMLRVINTAALATKVAHGERAERGGMLVTRLWATAYRMKKRGYLGEAKDCLPLEPRPFHNALRTLVELGYYDAYAGVAEGPIKNRQPYSWEDCDLRQPRGKRALWHIVSRDKRGMSPSYFPVQCPNKTAMAIFKGHLSENFVDTAIHKHIRTTFELRQSERVFRAFRTLAYTYNRLREEGQKDISSTFVHISVVTLLETLSADLRKEDPMPPCRAEQLARAFLEIGLCVGILGRDRELYDNLTLLTPCDYQWLLSTLFGLQTSIGELDQVFFGGILLPGSSQIPVPRCDEKGEKELVSSLAAVVQGESGSGKTTFACHLGFDVVRYGGVCLYLALEQWPNDLQRLFYGFGWLPDRGMFDYLGPASIADQPIDEDKPEDHSDNSPEARYFRAFRERIDRNHLDKKGIFGLMPIRPRSWEQLRQWIDSFLAIEALQHYPISVLVLDPFNAFVALADPPSEGSSEGKSKGRLSHEVRAAIGEIFEALKSRNVNVLMVCEGGHAQDREIAHITNTSDLVFTLHRANLVQDPLTTETGFHAWSRHLSIYKSRFQKTLPGHHLFKITESGISIDLSPQAFVRRLEDNIPRRRLDLPLSSGFPDLDHVLRGESKKEGALCQNSFTVYMGPTGSAKSELAILFLLAPVANKPILKRIREKESDNRRSLLVTFRDDWASVKSVLGGPIGDYLGIKNLDTARKTLTILQLPVGFVSASEILAKLQKVFDEHANRGESFGRVVFDNLAYMELTSPLLKFEPYFIHSLMTLLRQKGVSVLFVTSSMDVVERSTLQARIRDGADNVVVFDRPQPKLGENATGTIRIAVLKSVHMEHYRERCLLSFGEKRTSEAETNQFESELSEALKGKDSCSKEAIEGIVKVAKTQAKGLDDSVSFENLIRELLTEACDREGKPKEKEKDLIGKITEIHRMQGFLRLDRK
uniref:RecA-superfamily ATPase, KaiC/GvpD/RAD55 family n=1 Tax=Candidatus Kentrum sp. FM TaxID=2126340 RepID=A0A450RXY4_9GAMM|nr:MAG: RecA-superfamily ATPase, KaiC/GvpD/RAD55 family [Candidatus Kentron sp. FM]VFJ43865.1 MAG: RecA-superfamily ATPase, KaiC/GvpD/RAD55 family [Candidatus Kentron sp. FM]VFK05759.1 MAG: RecA-superfamily ATPase, KaiC/GvpD/RAD55 family [Candidatus Kentron sp. FM]